MLALASAVESPRATEILKNITAQNVTLVLVALVAVWITIRLLTRLFNALSDRNPRVRFLAKLVLPAVRIFLWFVLFLFATEILSPTDDAFLAALGSAAIAIGLGAQDLIKNLIGGLVIIADRPYQIGDRVKIADTYGEVTDIRLRSTRIWTPDDSLVTVPNSEVLTGTAFNSNQATAEAMTVADVYLPPDTDPDLALRIGTEAILTSPFTHLSKRFETLLKDGYTERPYLTLSMKAYCYDHRYEPLMQSDLVRRAKREFLKYGLLAAWNPDVVGAAH